MPHLAIAHESEQRKLAAKRQQAEPTPETLQRFQLLANSGIPVAAASVLAKSFSALLERIGVLEWKIGLLEKYPPHLRKTERR